MKLNFSSEGIRLKTYWNQHAYRGKKLIEKKEENKKN